MNSLAKNHSAPGPVRGTDAGAHKAVVKRERMEKGKREKATFTSTNNETPFVYKIRHIPHT